MRTLLPANLVRKFHNVGGQQERRWEGVLDVPVSGATLSFPPAFIHSAGSGLHHTHTRTHSRARAHKCTCTQLLVSKINILFGDVIQF